MLDLREEGKEKEGKAEKEESYCIHRQQSQIPNNKHVGIRIC